MQQTLVLMFVFLDFIVYRLNVIDINTMNHYLVIGNIKLELICCFRCYAHEVHGTFITFCVIELYNHTRLTTEIQGNFDMYTNDANLLRPHSTLPYFWSQWSFQYLRKNILWAQHWHTVIYVQHHQYLFELILKEVMMWFLLLDSPTLMISFYVDE